MRNELSDTLWGFRREFAVVGVFSAVANLMMLAPTVYMLQVYDRVLHSRSELTLLVVSLITLFMFAMLAVAEWSRSRVLVRTGVKLDAILSTRVFNASFDANMNQAGINAARSFADLTELRQFITGNGVFAFFDTPWTPIYIAVLFLLHPMLGWVAIVFALIQGVMLWAGQSRTVAPAREAQDAHQQSIQYLQAKLRNGEAVESMGMMPRLRARWFDKHQASLKANESSHHTSHSVTALSKWVRYSQSSLALGAGAYLVVQGELTAGAMIAANVLMSRALAPIDQLVGVWRQFAGTKAAYERLTLLLSQYPEQDPALHKAKPEGRVDLQGVVVAAPGRDTPILKGVDLSLKPGQVTVVLGPSGSGKSTLARVALGLWTPMGGEVLLDDKPLSNWSRDELGPYVGYLPQDIELFDGTIAENIARLGEVDSTAVIAAAQAAGLHDMILRFPKGYDTPMGIAGSVLSGGQRQRVALARALYKDPVLMVLDEPNANLDDVGEQALARAVMGMKQNQQTVLLITHRPGAIALADQLVVMKDGQVQAAGPRDDVLALFKPAATPPIANA